MAYATPEQLAEALETRVTTENQEVLVDCLEAAAAEIDHIIGAQAVPVHGLVVRTNVNRAVEWYKAPATYNGGVGMEETVGTLQVPTSGFERHAAVLLPFRTQWGVA